MGIFLGPLLSGYNGKTCKTYLNHHTISSLKATVECRRLRNAELYDLYSSPNISRVIA